MAQPPGTAPVRPIQPRGACGPAQTPHEAVAPLLKRAFTRPLPGGTFLLTLRTRGGRALFTNGPTVGLLRRALQAVRAWQPFEIEASIVLPEHLHLMWTLPPDDADHEGRVRKLRFAYAQEASQALANSGRRVAIDESTIWEDHHSLAVRDADEFADLLDYVHYNPVEHGLAACPHQWAYSTFQRWVKRGPYDEDWFCRCAERRPPPRGARRRSPPASYRPDLQKLELTLYPTAFARRATNSISA